MCSVQSGMPTATLPSNLSPLEGSSTLSKALTLRSTGIPHLPSEVGTPRLMLPPKGE